MNLLLKVTPVGKVNKYSKKSAGKANRCKLLVVMGRKVNNFAINVKVHRGC
jgi:hypothetical protein